MNVSNPRLSTEMFREPNGQGEEAAADPIRQLYFSIVCDQSLPNEGCAFIPSSSERPDSLNRVVAAWPNLSARVQDLILRFAESCESTTLGTARSKPWKPNHQLDKPPRQPAATVA